MDDAVGLVIGGQLGGRVIEVDPPKRRAHAPRAEQGDGRPLRGGVVAGDADLVAVAGLHARARILSIPPSKAFALSLTGVASQRPGRAGRPGRSVHGESHVVAPNGGRVITARSVST